MTTPRDFQKIRAFVHELIDLPPAARTQRLAEIRQQEGAIADEVQKLLAHIELDDLRPAPAAVRGVESGRRIGPFELTAQIGAGGMGLVFDAQRVDGTVAQRVAIKLPGRSLLSTEEQRRLKRERDLLARLEHPNIARLIDAGNEPGVGPWFAMEYVDGIPITRYADRQRLGIRARLQLWLQLTEAVVYAHQHLIVHRDLKPANVLVDASGRVKLLDFGIANFFQVDTDAMQSTPAFTPRYASPEQIAGEPITTATDVHGLGLLLFELLCGSQAFVERSDLALRQAIATTEAPSLCAALTRLDSDALRDASQARALTRAQWLREMGGELKAIVARSLRKLPSERYASVMAFADDVQRYLDGEKVQAMAPTLVYRLGKFARRNRLVLVASAAVLMALTLGLIATMLQRDRALDAESAARIAEAETRAENGLLADVLGGGPDYLRGGADMRVRDLLHSSAEVIASRSDLSPVSRARLLHTLAEGLLAMLDDAAADAVLARAEQSLAQTPGADELLLRIRLKRGWVRFERGDHETAMAETAALWPQLQQAGGAVLLEALQNRAHFHSVRRAFDQALLDLDAAQQLASTMRPPPQRDLSQIRYNRIHTLMNLQRNDEAWQLASEHLATAEAQPPEFISARISATEMFARAASKVGRFVEAEQRLTAILPAAERLYQGRGNRLAGLVGALASAHRASGRMRDAARQHHRQALLRQETLPDSVYVASALRFEGVSLRALGDTELAEAALLKARALFQKLDSQGEVLHCDLHLAATRAMMREDSASLSTLQTVVDRIISEGEPSDRIEAPMLAIEVALRLGEYSIASDRLAQLQTEAGQQNVSEGMRSAIALYAAEIAQAKGGEEDLTALVESIHGSGDALLQARLASLRVHQSRGDERGPACAATKRAWSRVDDLGLAWTQRSAKLGCAEPKAY